MCNRTSYMASNGRSKDHFSCPIMIYCDNRPPLCMTKNSIFHGRIKHVDLHYHFIRDQAAAGLIGIKCCSTKEQIADRFMKVLGHLVFIKFHKELGLTSLTSRGSVENWCSIVGLKLNQENSKKNCSLVDSRRFYVFSLFFLYKYKISFSLLFSHCMWKSLETNFPYYNFVLSSSIFLIIFFFQ